jgi:NADH-quinone oxidoreductase subunit I
MPALKGVGLIKGLGVTLKTMTRPAATRQYPHVKPDLPARTRGVIALIEENCTVCMLCSRECPDWCIYIDSHKEQVAPKEGGRARTRNILDRFAIDFALCMYCGICVEVCPFDALHWSPEFEYAEHQIERLTHEMDTLRKWAYTVPAPDPLEAGAVEPKELEAARKAKEAVAAKAAAAAEQARASAAPAPAPTAPAAAETVDSRERAPSGSATLPEGAPPAAGEVPARQPAAARPADVEVEPGIDQATYERLLAAGEPDRTARAKAKAAYMRKAKAEARAAQAAGAAPAPAPPAEAGAPTTPAAGAAVPAVGEAPPQPASVETPAAAVAAPETAPAAPSAAGTPEAAEPAADARDPEARSPEGDPTASGTAVDVAPGAATAQADAEHLEVEVDQETYDRLIAAGEPERTARAKAKAAYARKVRAAQRGQQ